MSDFLNRLRQAGLWEHAANYRSYLGEAPNASLNTIPKWHVPRTIWSDDLFVYDMHERYFMQQPALEGIRNKICNCKEAISDAHMGICKKDGGPYRLHNIIVRYMAAMCNDAGIEVEIEENNVLGRGCMGCPCVV